MKKGISLLLVLLMLCSLCGVSAMAADAEEICGSYTLINMVDEDNADTSEMLQSMAAIGMTATLTVNEDGSASMDLFGEEEEMVFDFAEEVVRVNDNAVPFTYEDGILTIGDESGCFTFSREGIEAKKSRGAFRFYVLRDVLNADGESVLEESYSPEEAACVTLTLFSSDEAILEDPEEKLALRFDFASGTFEANGSTHSFEEEDGVLILTNDDGDRIFMEQADPGIVGPYVMTGMVSEEDGDLTEQLPMLEALDMLPKLSIEEDGSAVLDLFGEELKIQFDFEGMTVELEGEALPFTYELGTLTLGEEESFMRFGRVLPEEEAD